MVSFKALCCALLVACTAVAATVIDLCAAVCEHPPGRGGVCYFPGTHSSSEDPCECDCPVGQECDTVDTYKCVDKPKCDEPCTATMKNGKTLTGKCVEHVDDRDYIWAQVAGDCTKVTGCDKEPGEGKCTKCAIDRTDLCKKGNVINGGPCAKQGRCKCFDTSGGAACKNVLDKPTEGFSEKGGGCPENFCNAMGMPRACCPFKCDLNGPRHLRGLVDEATD